MGISTNLTAYRQAYHDLHRNTANFIFRDRCVIFKRFCCEFFKGPHRNASMCPPRRYLIGPSDAWQLVLLISGQYGQIWRVALVVVFEALYAQS
jgi:hypothetical protein